MFSYTHPIFFSPQSMYLNYQNNTMGKAKERMKKKSKKKSERTKKTHQQLHSPQSPPPPPDTSSAARPSHPACAHSCSPWPSTHSVVQAQNPPGCCESSPGCGAWQSRAPAHARRPFRCCSLCCSLLEYRFAGSRLGRCGLYLRRGPEYIFYFAHTVGFQYI